MLAIGSFQSPLEVVGRRKGKKWWPAVPITRYQPKIESYKGPRDPAMLGHLHQSIPSHTQRTALSAEFTIRITPAMSSFKTPHVFNECSIEWFQRFALAASRIATLFN